MAKKTTKKVKKTVSSKRRVAKAAGDVRLNDVLQWLERRGTQKQIRELDRYGITASRPFGVTVGDLKKYSKEMGVDHALALALWATGRFEARMLASMIDDPAEVSAGQMNAWAANFDNWAIVDTVCFHLFDRTPHAWKQVAVWAKAKPEFTKRAAFALLWSLSVHDKNAADSAFIKCLPLIESAGKDDRAMVKKAVNMALRAVGKRNAALHAAAMATAERMAKSADASAKWVGTHALRELQSAAVRKRISKGGR